MDIRKRLHGDPILPLNLQLFAEPAGGDPGAGGNDPAGAPPAGAPPAGDNPGAGGADDKGGNDPAAQLEQLKADMAKMKSALDKATHEASENKKALNEANNKLKAKMTQEEIDAAQKKEAEEKAAAHLAELEKKVAKAENTKSVMAKLAVDENTAGDIAESLNGCENVENVLLLIQKAWTEKEKALKLEYGKLPGPGTGGSNEEDAERNAAIEKAKQLGKARAESNKSVTEGLKGYIR